AHEGDDVHPRLADARAVVPEALESTVDGGGGELSGGVHAFPEARDGGALEDALHDGARRCRGVLGPSRGRGGSALRIGGQRRPGRDGEENRVGPDVDDRGPPDAHSAAVRLLRFSISSTFGCTTSSTRRFCRRPSSVSFSATGSVEP